MYIFESSTIGGDIAISGRRGNRPRANGIQFCVYQFGFLGPGMYSMIDAVSFSLSLTSRPGERKCLALVDVIDNNDAQLCTIIYISRISYTH